MNKQIEAMKKIGMTDAEIAEVLAADKAIDQGEKLFELSADQEKASKQARQVSRAPTVYKFQKKEKKVDNEKRQIIQQLVSAVAPNGEAEIINPEREFLFTVGEKKYKVVLSVPRK